MAPDQAPVHKPLDLTTKLALERTGLAHERTLMAWVRTCFSMIGFGFSLFSFILAMRKDTGHTEGDSLDDALLACLILTLGGTVFMVLAVVQFLLSIRVLFQSGLEKHSYLSIFAGVTVCAAGILCSLFILARI